MNPRRGDGRQHVEQELDGRGADADAAHERRPGTAEDLEARDPHVAAEPHFDGAQVREPDGVSASREGAD